MDREIIKDPALRDAVEEVNRGYDVLALGRDAMDRETLARVIIPHITDRREVRRLFGRARELGDQWITEQIAADILPLFAADKAEIERLRAVERIMAEWEAGDGMTNQNALCAIKAVIIGLPEAAK